MQTIHIGILSASDRASKGIYENLSGKAIQEGLSEYLLNPLEFHYEIVADERDLIEKSLIKMRDEYQLRSSRYYRRHRPCFKRYNPRSHRKSVPKNASWFWRAYAND
ncbi:hypothetical protein HpCK71_05220 [Helicobacter pylori]